MSINMSDQPTHSENPSTSVDGETPPLQSDQQLVQQQASSSNNITSVAIAESATRRYDLGKLFGWGNTLFTFLAFALFVIGFLVPATEGRGRGEKPLSMFYMVFGIFQASAAKHDPYVPYESQVAFTVVGVSYYAANAVSLFLRGCSFPTLSALVKFSAGLMMETSVFAYALLGDHHQIDITGPLAVNFGSGICATFGAVCMWASTYGKSQSQETAPNTQNRESPDSVSEYFQKSDYKLDGITAFLWSLAIVFTLTTANIPGWNKTSTTVWYVANQTDTTRVFSSTVLFSFGLSMWAIPIVGILMPDFCICTCLLNKVKKHRDDVWLQRAFKVGLYLSGSSFIFAMLAFTSDMFKGIDDDVLRPGVAFSFGWITALLYIFTFCVQIVNFLKKKLEQEKRSDLVRYVSYATELIFFLSIFIVYIQRNEEPVSILYTVFGKTPCEDTHAEYLKTDAKLTMQIGICVYITARASLSLIGHFYLIGCELLQMQTSSGKFTAALSIIKCVLGVVLFAFTLVYWIVFNCDRTDMTLVMTCLIGTSAASIVGSAIELNSTCLDEETTNTETTEKGNSANESNANCPDEVTTRAGTTEHMNCSCNKKCVFSFTCTALFCITSIPSSLASCIFYVVFRALKFIWAKALSPCFQKCGECIQSYKHIYRNHDGDKSFGERFYYSLHYWSCGYDIVVGVLFANGLFYQVLALSIDGWKVDAETDLFTLGNKCHSLESFQALYLPSFALACFGIFLFVVVFVTEFCGCKRAVVIFMPNLWLLLGGFGSAFATAALWLDILTGVDAGTWSFDGPFILSIVSTVIYSIAIFIGLLHVLGVLPHSEKEAPTQKRLSPTLQLAQI